MVIMMPRFKFYKALFTRQGHYFISTDLNFISFPSQLHVYLTHATIYASMTLAKSISVYVVKVMFIMKIKPAWEVRILLFLSRLHFSRLILGRLTSFVGQTMCFFDGNKIGSNLCQKWLYKFFVFYCRCYEQVWGGDDPFSGRRCYTGDRFINYSSSWKIYFWGLVIFR